MIFLGDNELPKGRYLGYAVVLGGITIKVSLTEGEYEIVAKGLIEGLSVGEVKP